MLIAVTIDSGSTRHDFSASTGWATDSEVTKSEMISVYDVTASVFVASSVSTRVPPMPLLFNLAGESVVG